VIIGTIGNIRSITTEWNLAFGVWMILAGSYGVPGFARGGVFSSMSGLAGAAAFWTIACQTAR
jgi:hypothetical protein